MFRLGAIETEQVDDLSKTHEIFKKSVRDENLAVLILSRPVYNHIAGFVDEYRENASKPLIVVIDG